MRNVTELSKLNGKVYVYLRDEVIARRFLQMQRMRDSLLETEKSQQPDREIISM